MVPGPVSQELRFNAHSCLEELNTGGSRQAHENYQSKVDWDTQLLPGTEHLLCSRYYLSTAQIISVR